jgi:hypothetical protein
MKRRLLNLLTAMSLLLCVAVVVVWVRSYWVGDALLWGEVSGSPVSVAGVSTSSGVVAVGRGSVDADYFRGRRSLHHLHYVRHPAAGRSSALGRGLFGKLGFGMIRRPYSTDVFIVLLPMWLVAVLTALPPLAFYFRHRRQIPGLCPACGYDLRATPGKCPECGRGSVAAAA